MNGEAFGVPSSDHFVQALLDVELLVGRPHDIGDGLGKLVQLHGEQVLQSEGFRIHVEVLSRGIHQLLPVPEAKREQRNF